MLSILSYMYACFYDVYLLASLLFRQAHYASLDSPILSLEQQLVDLQVMSGDDEDDLEADNGDNPAVGAPLFPGIQDVDDDIGDEDDAEAKLASEGEEDDEETESKQDQTMGLELSRDRDRLFGSFWRDL